LAFDYRDTPGIYACPGAMGLTSEVLPLYGEDFPGWGCLENAACFGMFSCIQRSGSMSVGGFAPFYCGFDVPINDCYAPDFVPQGPCVQEIVDAFTEQEGAPPLDANDIFQQINTGQVGEVNGVPQWANRARSLAELCLVESRLAPDLQAAFDAGRLGTFTVQQCLDACITN
jgi:hypothetical protein